ncbi:hypothetical protein LZG75_01270 [Polynucleobacter sp. IMCC30063]|uniref:hypothetical protein n=1 Tax=Polynucleobacter sp. IMCC30063 TaxID=2907298 RepID=UPI001F46C94C|nr:hypothetical protein [Polynucleobacter sp. IMCC30063]MCE7504867.1 hypothetical protein [Polynucleobacter sp. IMCC30063]
MRMNEFMKDEDKNELLQLLNQFFASKFAAPPAQPNQTSQPKPTPPPNKAIPSPASAQPPQQKAPPPQAKPPTLPQKLHNVQQRKMNALANRYTQSALKQQAQPTETDKVLALRNVAQQKFDNK